MLRQWTIRVLVTAFLTLGAPVCHALEFGTLVTGTSKKALGLDFGVKTESQDGSLTVQMEIPRKDKLKELHGVRLELRTGRRRPLKVPVATREEDGTTFLRFEVDRELARDCYIHLITEDAPATCAFYYSVRLRDFITDGTE